MTSDSRPTPIACVAALAFLQRQLDGDVADPPPVVEAHLEACADCRERFQAVPDLLAGLVQLDSPQPSALVTERLIAELQRDDRRRQWQKCWQLAGALAAALLLAVWLNRPRLDMATPVPNAPATARVEPPALRRSITEAGDAVVALSQRAARAAVGNGTLSLPNMSLATPADPLAAPLADARLGLEEGFEPVMSSARRAVRLFLRDVPLEKND